MDAIDTKEQEAWVARSLYESSLHVTVNSQAGPATSSNSEEPSQTLLRRSGRDRKPSQRHAAAEEYKSPSASKSLPVAESSKRARVACTTERDVPASPPKRSAASRPQSSLWCWEEEQLVLELWSPERRKSTNWDDVSKVMGRSSEACRTRHHYLVQGQKRSPMAADFVPPKNLPLEMQLRIKSFLEPDGRRSRVLTTPDFDAPPLKQRKRKSRVAHEDEVLDQQDATVAPQSEGSPWKALRVEAHTEFTDAAHQSDSATTKTSGAPAGNSPASVASCCGSDDSTAEQHFICTCCKYSRPLQSRCSEADDTCVYCNDDIHGMCPSAIVMCEACGAIGVLGIFATPNGFPALLGGKDKTTCTSCQRIALTTPVSKL